MKNRLIFLLMLNAWFVTGCSTTPSYRRRGDELQLPNVGDFQYFPEYVGNEINAVGFLIVLVSLIWLMKSLVSNSKLKELLIYTNSGASLLMLFGGTLTTIELYKLVSHRMIDFRLYVSPSNTNIDWQDINSIEGNIYGISDAVSFIVFFFFIVFIWSQTFPNKSKPRHRNTFLTERNARQGMLILLASALFFVVFWSAPLFKSEVNQNSNNKDIAFDIKSRRLHYTPNPTLKRYAHYKKEVKAIITHNASLFTCADGVKVTNQIKCYSPPPTPQFKCWNGDMVFNSGQCPINHEKIREEREAAVKLAHKKFQQIEGKGPLSEFDKFLNNYSSFQELSQIVKIVEHQKNIISKFISLGTETHGKRCVFDETSAKEEMKIKSPMQLSLKVFPPAFETVSETIVVQDQSRKGATFETMYETVVVQEAATELIVVPEVFETVTDYALTGKNKDKVIVFEYRLLKTPQRIVERVIPAVTMQQGRRVVKTPGTGVMIPAITKSVTRRVVWEPARTEETIIPEKIITVPASNCF